MDMTNMPRENVIDYPRPPRIERFTGRIVVTFGGRAIVDVESAWRILETYHPPTYYIAPEAFAAGVLVPVPARSSFCEWKGMARYFDIVSNGRTAPAAAWSYEKPNAPYAAIADHVALYAEPMDRITVAGAVVRPQPGNFYGGWVTPNVTGPIKGAPGTNHW